MVSNKYPLAVFILQITSRDTEVCFASSWVHFMTVLWCPVTVSPCLTVSQLSLSVPQLSPYSKCPKRCVFFILDAFLDWDSVSLVSHGVLLPFCSVTAIPNCLPSVCVKLWKLFVIFNVYWVWGIYHCLAVDNKFPFCLQISYLYGVRLCTVHVFYKLPSPNVSLKLGNTVGIAKLLIIKWLYIDWRVLSNVIPIIYLDYHCTNGDFAYPLIMVGHPIGFCTLCTLCTWITSSSPSCSEYISISSASLITNNCLDAILRSSDNLLIFLISRSLCNGTNG